MKSVFKSISKLLSGSVTLSLCLSAQALTSDQDMIFDDADMAEQNEISLPQIDADEAVDNAINAYFESRGITEGQIRKGGKVYYSSRQVVSVGPENPQWAKARQLAFEAALLEARARFVFDNVGRTVNTSEQILRQDDSSDNREFAENLSGVSKIAALWDKAVALGDARLNKWLTDLDVDPTQFDAVPAAQRKDLFIKHYVSNTISKAMGQSSGLLPVQTFEGSDNSGATVIGLIMLYSPKLKQLASDIANQRAPMLTGKNGKPIADYVNIPGDALAAQFGVRVVFDEQGAPVVLSFGQWGYSYRGNNQKRIMRNRQNAADTADTKAIEGLVNFINSQLSLNNKSTTGSVVENYMLKRGDDITEKDISTMIDRSVKTLKSRASATMAGTRVIKKWKYKDSNGQEIVGRVRAWSQASSEASKDIRNFKAQKTPREESSGKTGGGKVRSGTPIMAPEEDF